MKLTPAQDKAIHSRGKSLLVSASAGSGKTFVMTKRIVDLVVNDKVPITSFLIVTFTKAAAGEMKTKLLKEFEKLPQKTDYIKTQMQEVATIADISTIDGFCAKMLKTYFYKLGLDPTFVVMDEDESAILQEKAMEQLFETHIQNADSAFFDLADVLQQSRSDQKLRNTILKIFQFMRVQTQPRAWAQQVMQSYEPNLEKNIAGRYIVSAYTKKLHAVLEPLLHLRKQIKNWDAMLQMLNEYNEEILSLIECHTLPSFYQALQACVSRRSPSGKTPEQKEWAEQVKEWKASYAAVVKSFAELGTLNEMQQKLTATAPRVAMLFSLAQEFETLYHALKKEKGAYDFGDLEQFTLQLLQEKDVQEEVRTKYKYIFIDEYQDTNYLQEEILACIAKPDSLFMVGDVKQSIYRFRLCEPQIFINRMERYKHKDAQAELLFLNDNFRSNENILHFVNMVFKSVMTKEFGGVDYKNENMLTHGEVSIPQASALPVVQGCFIVKPTAPEAEEEKPQGVYSVLKEIQQNPSFVDETDREAILIARTIQQFIGKPMFDTKTQTVRPIEYQDITILTASRENVVEPIQRVCLQAGIPVLTDITTSIFDEDVLQILKQMLELIHNPYQDIPMLGVLTSNVFKFTLEELSEIRMLYPAEKYYHQAFLKALQEGGVSASSMQKMNAYMSFVTKYFERSKYLSVAELVKAILQETNFKESILNQTNGEKKLQTLQIFLQKIESGKYQMLAEFLQNLEKIDMKTSVASQANAVNITTIHQSKGLEYPVVILAGVGKKANNKDTQTDLIFSKKIGIGLEYFSPSERIKNPTVAWLAAKLSEEMQAKEERARLLYVALTRAVHHLVVVGTVTQKQLAGQVPKPSRTDNFADWIMYGLHHTPKAFLEQIGYQQHTFTVAQIEEMAFQEKQVAPPIAKGTFSQALLAYLQKPYPYMQDVQLVTKTTVSKVLEQNREDVFYPIVFEEETTPELGTAYHKLMEVLPLEHVTAEMVQQAITRLVENNLLSRSVAQQLSLQHILRAIQTLEPLCAQAQQVKKEAEFLMQVEPAQIGMQGTRPVLVQGVVDLLIEKEKEIVVVDYKYTAIKNAKHIIEKYQPQLSLYAQAAQASFSNKPCKAYIYSFVSHQLLEVPLNKK